MAEGINTVVITGNLTRDPEIRYAGETPVTDLGVAVNGSEKVGGQWQDRADFFDVTVWGKQAENICNHLHRGSPVAVHGKLRYETWDDKQTGDKRSKVKIVARDVQWLPSKPRDGAAERGRPAPQSSPAGRPPQEEEDIPF